MSSTHADPTTIPTTEAARAENIPEASSSNAVASSSDAATAPAPADAAKSRMEYWKALQNRAVSPCIAPGIEVRF